MSLNPIRDLLTLLYREKRAGNPKPVEELSDWNEFVSELQSEILPFYLRHELSFDSGGVHGRMHICRSVIFAEYMARFYRKHLSQAIDFYAVRHAVAFHDSGRKDNGVDLWERDSAENCLEYVQRERVTEDADYPQYVASLIEKRQTGDDAARWIVYDADVLEIMRPCCGHGGLDGFQRKFLHFAGSQDALTRGLPNAGKEREALIREAWRWIKHTEKLKPKLFRSKTYFPDVLDELANKKRKFPMLASLVLD